MFYNTSCNYAIGNFFSSDKAKAGKVDKSDRVRKKHV